MAIYGRAPFTYTDKIVEVSKSLRGSSRYSTAKNVFDWMQENIKYNNYAKGIIRSIFLNYDYKSAHQVFRAGEGICLDQSYLYCVLAKYAGISSDIVEVTKDCNGEKVWHACCSVNTGNERLLVDPAYFNFDAKHEDYSIMSEEEARNQYNSLRHCYENDECIVEKFVSNDEIPLEIPNSLNFESSYENSYKYGIPNYAKKEFEFDMEAFNSWNNNQFDYLEYLKGEKERNKLFFESIKKSDYIDLDKVIIEKTKRNYTNVIITKEDVRINELLREYFKNKD